MRVILLKADIVIQGCVILSALDRSFINDGLIAIHNSEIAFAGRRSSAPQFSAETVIKADSKVAIPGLVNCHTHLPMTLFRGLADDKPLDSWLRNTIWPLESKLKQEDVFHGALLGCLEMIRSGTTCFADMYFHEEMVARAVQESGLRGVLAEGIIGPDGGFRGKALLNRSVAFAKRFDRYACGRVRVMLGPHSAYSCSKELLEEVSEQAYRLGVGTHIHLAESKNMLENSEGSQLSETELLDRIGFFKGHVLAAHCIDLTGKDRSILSHHGVKVAYVPVSNAKLGLDIARVKDLIDQGVCVGLGTDGPASNGSLDMFETMKVGVLLQRHVYRNAGIFSAGEALRMATIEGARALGMEKEVGLLEAGKKADLVLIDFSNPHLKPSHDICSSIVFSARGSDVDTVIVDGKILMSNRHLTTLDEQAVIEKAENASLKLHSR